MTYVIVGVTALLCIFFFAGYNNEKRARSEYAEKLKNEYGRAVKKLSLDELKAVKGYRSFHDTSFSIDDTTWNDLDMWLIYKQINFCQSSAGDEYLYYLLADPVIRNRDHEDMEKTIEALEDEDTRIKLQLILHDIGRTGQYSIYYFLDALDKLDGYSLISDYVLDILYIPAIVLCFFHGLLGTAAILAVMTANIITYFRKKSMIEPYFICFDYVFRILDSCEGFVKTDCDAIRTDIETLKECCNGFKRFKRFSSLAVKDLGSSPLGVLLGYIRMLTHVDLIKFKSMLEQVKNGKDKIDTMITVIGRIDSYISIGHFRHMHECCIPDLSEGYDELKVIGGYHPLISKPVANDIMTKGCVLLTGSNASGKSTFLKMVAVNSLLAQSIHTVCAKEYRAPYFRLYSSLSLKDNIMSGESYYMVEIRSVKRILDAADEDTPVLGFIDEVLRGTNTTERIAASTAILRNLSRKKVWVFAATHDLELTELLSDEYDNYHFEESFTDNDISFPYHLLPGKAKERNAIKLLELFGYDRDITREAHRSVEVFEEKGYWEK